MLRNGRYIIQDISDFLTNIIMTHIRPFTFFLPRKAPELTCMYACMQVRMNVCMHVCIMYVCMYVCTPIPLSTNLCVDACMYVYIYIDLRKVGQTLAQRPDVVGEEAAAELKSLQAGPLPFQTV